MNFMKFLYNINEYIFNKLYIKLLELIISQKELNYYILFIPFFILCFFIYKIINIKNLKELSRKTISNCSLYLLLMLFIRFYFYWKSDNLNIFNGSNSSLGFHFVKILIGSILTVIIIFLFINAINTCTIISYITNIILLGLDMLIFKNVFYYFIIEFFLLEKNIILDEKTVNIFYISIVSLPYIILLLIKILINIAIYIIRIILEKLIFCLKSFLFFVVNFIFWNLNIIIDIIIFFIKMKNKIYSVDSPKKIETGRIRRQL